MKKTLLILFLMTAGMLAAQVNFDDYFTDKTMRLDYIRAGNDKGCSIYFEQLKQEPFWSGNKNSLIDRFEYGHYRYYVYDAASDKLS